MFILLKTLHTESRQNKFAAWVKFIFLTAVCLRTQSLVEKIQKHTQVTWRLIHHIQWQRQQQGHPVTLTALCHPQRFAVTPIMLGLHWDFCFYQGGKKSRGTAQATPCSAALSSGIQQERKNASGSTATHGREHWEAANTAPSPSQFQSLCWNPTGKLSPGWP